MADLLIDIIQGDLENVLKKVEKAADTTQILDEAGALALNRIRTRFLAEEAPDGTKWPQSEAAKKRRAKGGTGTLFDTGRLFRSIQLAGAGPNERVIGSDVPYGIYHQKGEGQERREFIGFSQMDQSLMVKLVLRRFQGI